MKISKLLYNESKWTKDCLGRDKNGSEINNFNVVHRDGKETDLGKDAVSFSLYGAVIRLYGPESQADVFSKLGDAVRQYTRKKIYLAQFNDDRDTTFKDIQNVLEIANL